MRFKALWFIAVILLAGYFFARTNTDNPYVIKVANYIGWELTPILTGLTDTGEVRYGDIQPEDRTRVPICTMEYLPVCAQVTGECFQKPCEQIVRTFGNKCQMENHKGAIFLHDGECKPTETITKPKPESAPLNQSNPASVNCIKQGGTLTIVTAVDGSQLGYCTFSNGKKCEERAFMRGDCTK